jgi:branched-chain amino acid transport system ATP-binding protein
VAEPLLAVRDLHAWYGESHVLHGVDFDVRPGEVVTLLGRNGAGKTTTLKAIMGIVRRRAGSVRLGSVELIRLPSNVVARLGIAFCPEERGIFASLDVDENLMLPPRVQPGGLTREAIFDLFPNLRERLRSPGARLSGGEQQMLAIGRTIARLKAEGFTILLVEQNFHFAATVADRHYIVEHGRVVDLIPNARLGESADKLHEYLGV